MRSKSFQSLSNYAADTDATDSRPVSLGWVEQRELMCRHSCTQWQRPFRRRPGGALDDDTYISLLDLQRVDARWSWGVRRVPVDVSAELGELWDSMRSVVLTSATLQVNGSFSHLIDRLGLGYVESLSLETPFTELSDNEIVVIRIIFRLPAGA